jgi:predicted RecA/RadA family phage recombinase
MPEATNVQDGVNVDYTPGADVLAGKVVVINGTVRIVNVDIASGVLGATAAEGVFDVTKGATTFADGGEVFWDDTNKVATPTATGPRMGKAVKAAVSSDPTVRVKLIPAGHVRVPTSTVAATGSVQGDAAQLQEGFNLVTAADGTKGVILPAAVAGMVVQVKNNTNAVLKVYPAASDTVNALSANAAISVAAFTNAVFTAYDATAWYTNPLLPS